MLFVNNKDSGFDNFHSKRKLYETTSVTTKTISVDPVSLKAISTSEMHGNFVVFVLYAG